MYLGLNNKAYYRKSDGSSNWTDWYEFYSTLNKPNASDVKAISSEPAERPGGNVDDYWQESALYEVTHSYFDDPPHTGSWDATLFVWAGVNQVDQWLCPTDGYIYHRIDDSNPVTGDHEWKPWHRVYTSHAPPTATEVGARPSDWMPAWGDVTGKPAQATRWPKFEEVTDKPSTFPPATHNHDDDYAPRTHSHSWESVTDKPSTFPPASHEHTEYAIPAGIVTMFAGTEAQVPSGWQLCNGSGETSNGIKVPDLRNRFIVGSGTDYDTGNTGGATSATSSSNGSHSHTVTVNSDGSHSHTVTVTVSPTTLSISQMPKHRHEMGRITTRGTGSANNVSRDGNDAFSEYSGSSSSHEHTASASSNNTGAHTHSASSNSTGDHTHTVSTLPPYYALAYIIKL